eukprot:TRINITY_DN105565_c3_g1_i1.p1 TRINITY_DN105565_c3_g1~~TRINITY_DN105565_c3_g1_i1.p1  ORF type:complete len:984 (+),score=100.01 TRINITY_DN105565_c3_g1_i1:379-3330(+)
MDARTQQEHNARRPRPDLQGQNSTCLLKKKLSNYSMQVAIQESYLTIQTRSKYCFRPMQIVNDYLKQCNEITATACSKDKKWLVTADLGNDSVMVVWDADTGTPVKTIFNPNPGGVRAVAISDDAEYIATLGDMIPEEKRQTLYVWKRDSESREPVASLEERPISKGKVMEFDFVVFKGDDPHELAVNGKRFVCFLKWTEGKREIDCYEAKGDKMHTWNYTMTAFIHDGAVTATDEGKIVVWGKSVLSQDAARPDMLSVIKVVQVGPEAKKGKEDNTKANSALVISVLIVQDDMIVAGFGDGSVKFYNPDLKVKMWFEEFGAVGEIRSISFSLLDPENMNNDFDSDPLLEKETVCPNFLVADHSGVIRQLKSELHYQPKNEREKPPILLEGYSEAVVCIATHPAEPVLAIGTYKGTIQLWNYETKKQLAIKCIFSEEKNTHSPWVMSYTPINDSNLYLMVGCTDGTIKAFPQAPNPETQVKDLKIKDQMLTAKRFFPEQIAITKDALFMATRDNDFCVSLFRFEMDEDISKKVWHFCGKCRTHLLPITSIAFVETTTGKSKYRLFSIGEDMKIFEYDVMASTEYQGLIVKEEITIEQEAYPSALLAYPPIMAGGAEFLVWFNTNYKAKLWDINGKICRKTSLGPVYAREVTKTKLIDNGEGEQYLAYATESKVIGLIKLPLDGNPHKTMGLIAHSGKIADLCVSKDGKYLFTCGGKAFRYRREEESKTMKSTSGVEEVVTTSQDDYSVGMWAIDVLPIEQGVQMGGEGVEPFLSLIEGRTEGQTYKDIVDYFFYSQILSKDEYTTKIRKLDGKVPLDQLPNLMRAMGCYPTEMEIKNIMNEVKYDQYEETGEYKTSVDLEYFIKLFVNHRPVYGINNENINEAFKVIGKGKTSLKKCMCLVCDNEIADLLSILQAEGEKMSTEELTSITQGKKKQQKYWLLWQGMKLKHQRKKCMRRTLQRMCQALRRYRTKMKMQKERRQNR